MQIENIQREKLEIPNGFSWTTLFFHFFVPLIRGDIKFFFIMLISDLLLFFLPIAFVFMYICWAYIYNDLYLKEMIKRGFKKVI